MGYQSNINNAINTAGQLAGLGKIAATREKETALKEAEMIDAKSKEIASNKLKGAEMMETTLKEGLADKKSAEGKIYHQSLDEMNKELQEASQQGLIGNAAGIYNDIQAITNNRIESIQKSKLYKMQKQLSKTGNLEEYNSRYAEYKIKMSKQLGKTMAKDYIEKNEKDPLWMVNALSAAGKKEGK